MLKMLRTAVMVPLALGSVLLAAGQAGLLRGKPRAPLGVRKGRLAPPARTPNSVSSQALLYAGQPGAVKAAVEPLHFQGDAAWAFGHAARVVADLPNTRIVERTPTYVHAECTSAWFNFVDDVELLLDAPAQTIHLRSASRIGRKDFGANRQRADAIHAAYYVR